MAHTEVHQTVPPFLVNQTCYLILVLELFGAVRSIQTRRLSDDRKETHRQWFPFQRIERQLSRFISASCFCGDGEVHGSVVWGKHVLLETGGKVVGKWMISRV